MPEISQQTVRTSLTAPEKAAEALVEGLSGTPKLVILFASHKLNNEALNAAVRERLSPDTKLMGASSAGEIDAEGMHDGTALLVALSGDFDVGIGLGRNLSHDPMAAGAAAMRGACEDLGVKPTDVDRKRYVGIVIDDGFKSKKDELLLGARSVCAGVTLVGGGANDDAYGPSPKGLLHLNREVTSNAVLIALLRTDVPWAVLQTHWFEPTGKTLRVTKTDSTRRNAVEIDGLPGLQRYASLVGTTVAELQSTPIPPQFTQYAVAQRLGREYFINSPFYANKDGSLGFIGMLDTSAEFEIMKMADISATTRKFLLEEVPKKVPNPQAGLLFHCTGRIWFSAVHGQTQALASAFEGVPWAAGLNVNFEIYRSLPVNTTLTALVFGKA